MTPSESGGVTGWFCGDSENLFVSVVDWLNMRSLQVKGPCTLFTDILCPEGGGAMFKIARFGTFKYVSSPSDPPNCL